MTRIPTKALFGGISRQAPGARHDNQVQDAENILFSVAHGATKRPGTVLGFSITDLTDTDWILHPIDRDGTLQWLVIIGDGRIIVCELDGTIVPVTISDAALTYLGGASFSAPNLRVITLADTTIIVNTTTTVAAKKSDTYAVDESHTDFNVMTSHTPTAGTFHHTHEDTVQAAEGYFRYDPGNATFANWTGAEVSTAWDAPGDNNWITSANTPAGFKITFTDNDGVDHVHEVQWQFANDNPASMEEIAFRIEDALRESGAVDATVHFGGDDTGAGRGKFQIGAPFRGATAAVKDITTPTPAGLLDMTSAGRPFEFAPGTEVLVAGTGSPEDDELTVIERWVRVAPPDQASAEIDETTMPVKMVRAIGPNYLETVIADGPFAYWRLGESTGTAASDEVIGHDGTYVATPTLGVPGALTAGSDTTTAVTFNGTSQYVNVGTLGTFGSQIADNGITIEAWIKINTLATIADHIFGADSVSGSFQKLQLFLHTEVADTCSIRLFSEDTAGGSNLSVNKAGVTLLDDAWHHIVVTLDHTNETGAIYIDGVDQNATVTEAGPVATAFADYDEPALVGANNPNGATTDEFWFNGSLDEVAIYLKQLGANDVFRHFTRGTEATTFDIDLIDWAFRPNGDVNTNPVPSLWADSRKIATIAFHRNRLVLAGDENIVFSQAGDFFNFYLGDFDNITDADPIDIALSADRVTLVDSVIPFRDTLAIFTKAGQQFELSAPENLTPTTAAITPTTAYDTLEGVQPAILGSFIYFAAKTEPGVNLFEYTFQESQLANAAANVSSHVPSLLPATVHTIVGAANSNTVILLDGDHGMTLFVYSFFWSGERKVQSAWSKWSYAGDKIFDIAIIGDDMWMMIRNGTRTDFVRQPLDIDTDDSPYSLHLDNQVTVTGVASGADTNFDYTFAETDYDTLVLVLGGDAGDAFQEAAGVLEQSSSQILKLIGDNTQTTADGGVVGIGFTSSLRLSRPFLKDREGLARLDVVLMHRALSIHHTNTSQYTIRLNAVSDFDETFTPVDGSTVEAEGDYRTLVTGLSTGTTIDILDTTAKPMAIVLAEHTVTSRPRSS